MFERLCNQEANSMEHRKKLLKREEEKKYSFKPKLSKKSKHIGRQSTLRELCSTEATERKLRKLRRDKERALKKECTFRPKTESSDLPVHASGFGSACPIEIMENIDRHRKRKSERLTEARQKFEQEMLSECTFEPNIEASSYQRVQPKRTVNVPGLERYLQNR